MPTTLDEQLALYLTDAHAIEVQSLVQVKRARKVGGDPEIAKAFAEHVRETERHEHYVSDRLAALCWAPVPQKDLAGKITGVGMALFARLQPDPPGKLVAHAYSYERMEMAVYELIGRLARRAGDNETVLAARMIHEEEQAMAERLAMLFDVAAEASLHDLGSEDLGRQLNKNLADAHAIEQRALQLLGQAPNLAGAKELANTFAEHLDVTRRHSDLVEERLRARDAGPSALKDAALRLGALNLSLFLRAKTDTPAKLAVVAYAFEHLEIAAYELLKRVAARAGDEATVSAATSILVEERAAAAAVHGQFDGALDASLEEAGVTVP